VYAINPLAVSRYRDRHQLSAAKFDAGDAKVLADLVRTDRHNHRQTPATSTTKPYAPSATASSASSTAAYTTTPPTTNTPPGPTAPKIVKLLLDKLEPWDVQPSSTGRQTP
jgi:hypothetical protein